MNFEVRIIFHFTNKISCFIFSNFDDFGETRVEAHLLKLPELSRWTDVNISVLLNQFSDESKVKEVMFLI